MTEQPPLWDDDPLPPTDEQQPSCVDCGAPTLHPQSPHCAGCRLEHRRTQNRDRTRDYRARAAASSPPQATDDEHRCRYCGVPVARTVNSRGWLSKWPQQCPECRKVQNRRRDAEAARRRSQVQLERICVDCGGGFRWNGTGQASPRCADCRAAHVRAVRRTRWTGRTVEEEKAREVTTTPTCEVCGADLPDWHRKRCETCQDAYHRAYGRAHRNGTTIAEEIAREATAGCRICGQPARSLHMDFCDDCTANGRRRVYRRARRQYGLGHEDAKIVSAAVVCAICSRPLDRKHLGEHASGGSGTPDAAHIDHDHDTGQVRGVLCGRCNKGLGHFHDNIATMLRAVDYLYGNRCVIEVDDVVRSVGFRAPVVIPPLPGWEAYEQRLRDALPR